MTRLVFILFAFSLFGCSSTKISDYKGTRPELVMKDYFRGKFRAYGTVADRSGQVIRHFKAEIIASWKGEIGTLDESFTWNDGEKQKRVWTLKMTGEKTFEGTAGDVVGKATGAVEGHALNMKYTLRVPVKSKTYDIKIDDWMYLLPDGILLNKSQMSKFGFHVGEIQLVFLRK